MHPILIAGAGRIGMLIACLLAQSRQYQVFLLDNRFDNTITPVLRKKFSNFFTLPEDAKNLTGITQLVKQHKIKSLISCLPYYHNIALAKLAKALQLHYFDLTEDVHVSQQIQQIAKNAKTIFMPHCGIAPGLVNIIAHGLMQTFNSLDTVKLRVGALPQYTDNALGYALTWSTEGLINEYINTGLAIANKKLITTLSLEDLEQLTLEGIRYEAFNTSGGLGTLMSTYKDKVNYLNYKTLRYPGHCEKMRFLLEDLNLKQDVKTLKTILENALPGTQQDVVIIYIAVNGNKNSHTLQETYLKKIYPKIIAGLPWTAIQVATAASACAVIAKAHTSKKLCGFILQEQFNLAAITDSFFCQYLDL